MRAEPITVTETVGVTLTLTKSEAESLMKITDYVSGNPSTSSRVATDRLRYALEKVGVTPKSTTMISGMVTCRDTFKDDLCKEVVYELEAGETLKT